MGYIRRRRRTGRLCIPCLSSSIAPLAGISEATYNEEPTTTVPLIRRTCEYTYLGFFNHQTKWISPPGRWRDQSSPVVAGGGSLGVCHSAWEAFEYFAHTDAGVANCYCGNTTPVSAGTCCESCPFDAGLAFVTKAGKTVSMSNSRHLWLTPLSLRSFRTPSNFNHRPCLRSCLHLRVRPGLQPSPWGRRKRI